MPRMYSSEVNDKLKEPKPTNIKEVPRYLKNVLRSTGERLFYIARLVWEAKPSLLFLMGITTLYNGVMPIIGTLITAHLLGQIVLSFTQEVNLIIPLMWQFGYSFINSLVNSLNNSITKISGEIVTHHVKVKIMNKAKTIDLASFDMPDFYERLENANREAGTRPVNIMDSTFNLISKIISMCSYFVVLSTILVKLGWTAYPFFIGYVALSIISAAVSFYFRRQNFLYIRVRSKERRQLTYYSDLMVNKDMVKEIRLFGLSDLFIGRYQDTFRQYFKGIKKIIWKEGGWNIFLALCSALLNGILFFMIATNVSQVADYSVYTGALNSISATLSALIATGATIYEGSLFIDNMILFMNEESHILCSTKEALLPKRHCGHTIELKDVCFAYPGSQKKVLNHINLTLNPGDTAVLVGLNGAGKTTLIKLLTRLYDPTEGQILLDGADIRLYDTQALYKLYGIIFQDFGKYAMNVEENIRFGDISKDYAKDEIEKAAVQANADQFIEQLKNGYETPLMRYFEKNGTELSIGQWQKLSVARAFYSDSDILILDEPTASLDPLAEQEIFNQFDTLRKDKTTLFVSHRLSSATTANKIIVLKDGTISEMGDHASLMAKKGDYYQLFSTQAKRYQQS